MTGMRVGLLATRPTYTRTSTPMPKVVYYLHEGRCGAHLAAFCSYYQLIKYTDMHFA
jgi:hypothetical protein